MGLIFTIIIGVKTFSNGKRTHCLSMSRKCHCRRRGPEVGYYERFLFSFLKRLLRPGL